jgi:hypothetical protein
LQVRTDADRLRWAVRFIATDVGALKGPALARLRRELDRLLGADARDVSFSVHVNVTRKPFPADFTAREFLDLQDAVRDLLEGAAGSENASTKVVLLGLGDDQRRWRFREFSGAHGAVSLDNILVDVVHDRRGTRTLRIGGSAKDGVLLSLAFLLATEAGKRVVRCPECGRIFMRVRRQIYCTARCTDRATWRAYPEHKKRRARKKLYDQHGWKYGARTKGGKK